MTRAPARSAWLVVGVLLAVSTIAGLAYVVLSGSADAGYDDEAAVLRDWCADAEEGLSGANGGPRSYAELGRLAESGALVRPDEPAPRTKAALDRWQRDHAAFAASAFLTEVRGGPTDVFGSQLVLMVSVAEAHKGERLSMADELPGATRYLDRYRRTHCSKP